MNTHQHTKVSIFIEKVRERASVNLVMGSNTQQQVEVDGCDPDELVDRDILNDQL